MNNENFDLAVIGSGPGGYVAAIRAAQLGLKVACIEKDPVLGGTCLNVGCIPSKALLHSSHLWALAQHDLSANGIAIDGARFDFAAMISRKQKIVKGFNEGVAALFKKNRITSFFGEAHFRDAQTLQVQGTSIQAKNTIIATGSQPMALPFLPFDEKKIVSSTGALSLQSVPKKMLVVGAGIIGVELASVYHRLGAEVQLIEFLDRICPTMDLEVATAFQKILEKQGLKFALSTQVTAGQVKNGKVVLETGSTSWEADIALISIGRKPYTQGLKLENAGISTNSKGQIPVDGGFRTSQSHIYAIGDVIDGPMLAHKASEEGVVVAEIIAGHKAELEYIAIPNVIYTYPEVASVGLTEAEAKALHLEIKTGSFPFKINSRARCTGDEEGLVKIISAKQSDRLLGVHIVGAHASELIGEATVAIKMHATTAQLAATVHAHPTLSEAIKEAALAVDKKALHR